MRPAIPCDIPVLRQLYATTRADELARTGWPEAMGTAFLASQFALQHIHFVTHFAQADFLVVLRGTDIAGRLYVDRMRAPWRLIDIALLPAARGAGAGTALLRWMQREARRTGAGIDLHVLHDNDRAARLYTRVGFVGTGVDTACATATHRRMIWPAGWPAACRLS